MITGGQLLAQMIHRFTAKQFFHMVEQGWFIDQRIEFIEGWVVDMWPVSNNHNLSITLTQEELTRAFGQNVWVRSQMPFDLLHRALVVPDLAVLPGNLRSHRGRDNPTSASLVVEVSESSLSYDRNYKASLLAVSGMQDYWIVNLPDHQLEIRRNIQPDASAYYGITYADVTILRAGDFATPLATPQALIAVADLLP